MASVPYFVCRSDCFSFRSLSVAPRRLLSSNSDITSCGSPSPCSKLLPRHHSSLIPSHPSDHSFASPSSCLMNLPEGATNPLWLCGPIGFSVPLGGIRAKLSHCDGNQNCTCPISSLSTFIHPQNYRKNENISDAAFQKSDIGRTLNGPAMNKCLHKVPRQVSRTHTSTLGGNAYNISAAV